MTAIFATADKILNQIPMSWARWATGRRRSHTILSESMRISKMLLARAKNGAKGNAATKIVMKPNWITVDWEFLASINCADCTWFCVFTNRTGIDPRNTSFEPKLRIVSSRLYVQIVMISLFGPYRGITFNLCTSQTFENLREQLFNKALP